MSEETTKTGGAEEFVERRRPIFSRKIYILFLLFGMAASIGSYTAVQSFADAVLQDDYGRVSREASEGVAKEFAEVEFALRTAGALISLSDTTDTDELVEKTSMVEDTFTPFKAVLWLRKVRGQWALLTVYENFFDNEETLDYKKLLRQDAVQKAMLAVLGDTDDSYFVTGLEDKRTPKALSSPKGYPYFMLLKSIKALDGQDSVVIGVSDLGYVFDTSALELEERVSDLTVRDVDSDTNLYFYERKNVGDIKAYEDWRSFDVKMGGKTLEINTRFFEKEDLLLLEILAYIVLGFGITLTFIVSMYLRSQYLQALKFTSVNKRLNEKNRALQAEVEKREVLNQNAMRADRENRAIIDSVSDIIFETDLRGKIVFLNAQWPKITGFEIEQSTGLEFFKILHPRDQHDVESEFHSLLHGKKQTFRKYTRIRTSDGTFRAAELSVSMINQDDKGLQRVVGTFTDVEERRRAERALSEAERKYRNIVQNAAGGIFQITPEGLYLSANPAMADILGYDNPEQILREVKNANRDVYVDANARALFLRDLEKNQTASNHETQVRRRDGSEIWVNENIHTVRDETGNVLYYEGSIEDISVRKRSALELQEAKMHSDLANRAKSEFLANMSHELRTPLNSIIGFSEMIRGEIHGEIEQRDYWEYAKDINDSGQRLLQVINEILDISKIEAGERELKESQVNVNKVAMTCVDLLSGKVDSGDLTVVNHLAGMPDLIGEELSIKQILMNLLSNAVKFTPKGGRVSLSYEMDRSGALHVSITDTGIGLDDEEIQRALSPFGQADNELSREGSGTGLGLTLVDALLKIHGAEFELVSQKGIGTTATAIFPKERVVVKKSKVAKPEAEKPAQEAEPGAVYDAVEASKDKD